MFVTTCPSQSRAIVVTADDVDSRTPTPHGTAIEFTCPCGGWGIYLRARAPMTDRLVLHAVGPVAA